MRTICSYCVTHARQVPVLEVHDLRPVHCTASDSGERIFDRKGTNVAPDDLLTGLSTMTEFRQISDMVLLTYVVNLGDLIAKPKCA